MHAALADVPAQAASLRTGVRLLCVWLDGPAYACELLGRAAHGRLGLGTWQGIYLFEHRAQRHRRQVAAHLVGE